MVQTQSWKYNKYLDEYDNAAALVESMGYKPYSDQTSVVINLLDAYEDVAAEDGTDITLEQYLNDVQTWNPEQLSVFDHPYD